MRKYPIRIGFQKEILSGGKMRMREKIKFKKLEEVSLEEILVEENGELK